MPASEQQQHIKCPFCETGHIVPKAGSTGCPKCYVRVWLDDRLECIFVDTKDFRLPVLGNVCSRCGLFQDYGANRCLYCGKELSSTIQ